MKFQAYICVSCTKMSLFLPFLTQKTRFVTLFSERFLCCFAKICEISDKSRQTLLFRDKKWQIESKLNSKNM